MADRNTFAPSTEDTLDESLWNSPVKPNQKGTDHHNGATNSHTSTRPSQEGEAARDAALRQELASVRKVNEALEGVLQNLDKAKSSMTTVNQTVGAASSLLNTWTRILSQTEHNQRLILDPSWHGTTQDMADIEAESQAKQQAHLRREAEEQERRAAAARKAEEAEQKRLIEPAKQTKPSLRGRGRASSRAASATTTGRTASSGYGSTDTSTASVGRGMYSSRRPASTVGRSGRGTSRGRG